MGRTSRPPCSGRWRVCGSGRACSSWGADVAVPRQLLERADVVAVLEWIRPERVAEGVGLARLGETTAARLSARCRTVSCRWGRWRCRVTQSRRIRVRLDSPSPAQTADRGRAMPTRSFSRGRRPTIACGRRSGKERQERLRLYGHRDAGLMRSRGLVARLHRAGRSSCEDRGAHPLERRRLCRQCQDQGRRPGASGCEDPSRPRPSGQPPFSWRCRARVARASQPRRAVLMT
jgi:hypothetical protein